MHYSLPKLRYNKTGSLTLQCRKMVGKNIVLPQINLISYLVSPSNSCAFSVKECFLTGLYCTLDWRGLHDSEYQQYFVNNALMPTALGNSSVVVRGKYANDFLGNPKCQENFHGMHSGLPFPSHAFGPTQEISLLKLAMGRWNCQKSMVSADIMTG